MLARDFADDPAFAWIIPDPAERARRLPRLFALMPESDAAAELALATALGEAATLWRAPARARVSRGEMLRRALPIWRALGPNLRRALKVGDAIDANMPDGRFWYLHVAGCEPARRRRGFGSEAVRAGLARATDAPAYLETARRENLAFYESLGFRLHSEWRVPGGGPPFWSMLRAA